MFTQDYNNENIATLGKEIAAADLPGFTGIMKNSRVDGKPPQLVIKVGVLTAVQETALIAVINAHPANEAARVADYELNVKYMEDRASFYAPTVRQLEMIYKDMKFGTTEFIDHNDSVRAAIPKPIQ